MPTLSELMDEKTLNNFASRVAKKAMTTQQEVIGLNHGFKTEKDILDRIQEGNAIDFDYDRLMEEMKKYA